MWRVPLFAALRREGLDWLVHECGLRGIRLLPVLTDGGSTAGGGMRQYIDWIDPALTVTDFYKNDTIKVSAAARPVWRPLSVLSAVNPLPAAASLCVQNGQHGSCLMSCALLNGAKVLQVLP